MHRQRTLLKTARVRVPSDSCHPELAEEPALTFSLSAKARNPETSEGEAEWDRVAGSGCLSLGWK